MLISDWSSDVCSSVLRSAPPSSPCTPPAAPWSARSSGWCDIQGGKNANGIAQPRGRAGREPAPLEGGRLMVPPRRRRRRRLRPAFLLLAAAVLAILWTVGLVLYARAIPSRTAAADRRTDAIVVLTGGSMRLEKGQIGRAHV